MRHKKVLILAFYAMCVVVLTGWGFFFASTTGGGPSGVTGTPTPTPTPGPLLSNCTGGVGTSMTLPLSLTINNNEGLVVMHKGALTSVDPGVTDSPAFGTPNSFISVRNSTDGCMYSDFAPISSGTGADTITINNPGTNLFNAATACTFKNFGSLDVFNGQPYQTNVNIAITGNTTPTTATDILYGTYYVDVNSGSSAPVFGGGSTNTTVAAGTPADLPASVASNTSILTGSAWEAGVKSTTVGFQRPFTASATAGNSCGGILALSSVPLSITSVAVTPASFSISVGQTQQLVATATLSSGATETISNLPGWTSNNTAVATVNSVGLVTAVAVGTATITDTYHGLSSQSSATITSAGGGPPGPPSLTFAATIAPNTTPLGICLIHGDGVTDDGACLEQIMTLNHDLDVQAGAYLINTVHGGSPDHRNMPNGRTILCRNTPPATQTTPSGITVSGAWANGAPVSFVAPTGFPQMFQLAGNDTIYGCQFRGAHYPNATWASDTSTQSQAIGVFTATGNDTIEENDFQGWGGFVGPINISGVLPSQQGGSATPANMLIAWNSFRNTAVRGIEMDEGQGQIIHNYFLDSPFEDEMYNSGVTAPITQCKASILIDSNWFHWVNGGAGGNLTGCNQGPGGNRESPGWLCHGSRSDHGCVTGTDPQVDYSQNTFSNNYIDGTGVANCQVEGAFGSFETSANIIQGVVRGNVGCTTANGCTVQGAPGNPNSNVWGAGSNQ